jgi:hypothetical protein
LRAKLSVAGIHGCLLLILSLGGVGLSACQQDVCMFKEILH